MEMNEWIQQPVMVPVMVPVVPPIAASSADVVPLFRSLLDTYKKELRVEVLDGLIGECYGPQSLLQGRTITDVSEFKEWLEAKLSEETLKTEEAKTN